MRMIADINMEGFRRIGRASGMWHPILTLRIERPLDRALGWFIFA